MIRKLNNIFLKKDVPGLLLRIICFIATVLIIDFCLGKSLDYYFKHQQSGWEYRTRYAMEETQAPILIFGGSRAEHQYSPGIFEMRLKQGSLNAGRDGQSIFYHYAVLKSILKRYTPKIAILDIENGFFQKEQRFYNDLSTLLPFYKEHPEIRPILQMRGPFEKVKLISHIYPYNSLLFNILAGNLHFFTKNTKYVKGFKPIEMVLNEPMKTEDHSIKYELDSNKIACFNAFLEDCRVNHVNLYIVYSPCYYKAIHTEYSLELVRDMVKDKNVEFLDYSADTSFLNNRHLFANINHLNVEGAPILSNKVADAISLNIHRK